MNEAANHPKKVTLLLCPHFDSYLTVEDEELSMTLIRQFLSLVRAEEKLSIEQLHCDNSEDKLQKTLI